ncbi:hypothetical protein CMUS01_07946 [Colletotrichum musicola]|uniref:Uncharacterized protein n=1 Tax=Colletotrichum musicola TaxID=2175873 RepID=A0A8H6KF56_9PEZI|nr:hypothetical protein CMUS01_07946 [Colletotrichum musicola]
MHRQRSIRDAVGRVVSHPETSTPTLAVGNIHFVAALQATDCRLQPTENGFFDVTLLFFESGISQVPEPRRILGGDRRRHHLGYLDQVALHARLHLTVGSRNSPVRSALLTAVGDHVYGGGGLWQAVAHRPPRRHSIDWRLGEGTSVAVVVATQSPQINILLMVATCEHVESTFPFQRMETRSRHLTTTSSIGMSHSQRQEDVNISNSQPHRRAHFEKSPGSALTCRGIPASLAGWHAFGQNNVCSPRSRAHRRP